jgi:ubiquinone biosynthesis monooxygenase Coq7
MALPQVEGRPHFDISIIRPEMRAEHCRLRGQGYPSQRLRAIKEGLRTLHTLELMAQTIYRFQITKERNDLNGQLITALCNEMGHYQDFQIKLYEYGFRPSVLRGAFWLVGFAFGLGSRLVGTKAILQVGIWVETKAVHHYASLLETVEWDDQTRRIIEKNQADEDGHVARWKRLLQAAAPVATPA